ncbi:RNA polymerase sigma factor [Aquimarina hainanensis]|uniref:RNA polymerase sigma factor n=1 Tax=Aquimarina hainanensis TaxID=1578017 RepID=A0ABW5NDN7_9FLAO
METNILYTHKELVEKSKSGDRNSQYQLYKLYVDAMYNISMRMLNIKEDAEDVTQESFIEAFKNLEKFRYESTFGSWLKRIVINKSINHLKLKRVPIVSIAPNEFHLTSEMTEYDIDMLDVEKIKKGISMLPDGYRQIINLYLIEGYDHVEIGEILTISTSTSKSQYHRAKKKLVAIIKTL